MPASVMLSHLLSPISTKFLQLPPIACRVDEKTSRPSSLSTVKVSFTVDNVDRKQLSISCSYKAEGEQPDASKYDISIFSFTEGKVEMNFYSHANCVQRLIFG
jgi:hypothetical protein